MKGSFKQRSYIDLKTGKKRKLSMWSVQYDLPRNLGEQRKRQIKSGFRTKADAEEWFQRKAQEMHDGIDVDQSRQTVEQYLRQWLTSSTVTASARHAYRNYVELHLIPVLGAFRLTDLRAKHIDVAKAQWAARASQRKRVKGKAPPRPLSARTLHHIFSTLRAALNRAKRQRLITVNPCDGVDPPRVERREMKALDATGGAKLLAAFENSDIGAPIITALGCGLRRGELLALRWDDIDLAARRLTVRRSIEREDGRTRFKPPKTARSARTISLPAFVADRLRRHRIEQAQRFKDDRLGRPTGDTLLFERGGEPWNPGSFGNAFRKQLRNAGLPHVRLHDLRHSFASMAIAAGVDLKTISTALGHSTIAVTADVYGHITEAGMRDVADRIDDAITSAAKKKRSKPAR
jgi:integrase